MMAYFCPLCESYYSIKYVDKQESYVTMQHNYAVNNNILKLNTDYLEVPSNKLSLFSLHCCVLTSNNTLYIYKQVYVCLYHRSITHICIKQHIS